MIIPPYYKQTVWQRFFAGVFIGAVIGWCVFIYIYGEMQEKQVNLIIEQQSKIRDLENQVEIWKKDNQELNEKNQKKLMIEEIHVSFTNDKLLKLDSLIKHTLHETTKEELKDLIKKDIETVSKNKELVIKTIENKVFKIENQRYQLKVEQLYLTTKLEIYLKIVPVG